MNNFLQWLYEEYPLLWRILIEGIVGGFFVGFTLVGMIVSLVGFHHYCAETYFQ